MKIDVLPDADAVAQRAAEFIADAARDAIAARGTFAFAVSGGRTPWQMLRALGALAMPWESTHLFQVDERLAPHGDADRNLTHIAESLLSAGTLPPGHPHPRPARAWTLAQAASD